MEHNELDVPHAECWWCGAEPVTYLASITSVRGLDHLALASPSKVYSTCHDVLAQGRDAELAERLTDEYDDWGRVQVVEHLHARVTGFTVAGQQGKRAVPGGSCPANNRSPGPGLVDEIEKRLVAGSDQTYFSDASARPSYVDRTGGG